MKFITSICLISFIVTLAAFTQVTETPCEFNLDVFEKNGKYGYCLADDSKNIVIEPKFERADLFRCGSGKKGWQMGLY